MSSLNDLFYYIGVAVITIFVVACMYAFCYVLGILTYSRDKEEEAE